LRRLKPFDYFEPPTVSEAIQALVEHGSAAYPLAGGTDLLVRRKRGDLSAKAFVNLKRIAGLDTINQQAEGLRIGALASISGLEHSAAIRASHPVLAEASGTLGSPSIRNLGTIGGNIGRASPASDIAPALIVLGGRVIAEGPQGKKEYEVGQFFRGPGKTVLLPGEVITSFFLAPMEKDSGAAYERLGRREGMECALVGVAAMLALSADGNEVRQARIALAAVGPVPLRASKAETVLLSGTLNRARLQEAARAAADDALPIDDMRASAAYRKEMVCVLTLRALQKALQRIPNASGAVRGN